MVSDSLGNMMQYACQRSKMQSPLATAFHAIEIEFAPKRGVQKGARPTCLGPWLTSVTMMSGGLAGCPMTKTEAFEASRACRLNFSFSSLKAPPGCRCSFPRPLWPETIWTQPLEAHLHVIAGVAHQRQLACMTSRHRSPEPLEPRLAGPERGNCSWPPPESTACQSTASQ